MSRDGQQSFEAATPRDNLRGCKILNFKAFEKNTLQGIFDLQLPFAGLVLRGCVIHRKGDSQWIGWPAKP